MNTDLRHIGKVHPDGDIFINQDDNTDLNRQILTDIARYVYGKYEQRLPQKLQGQGIHPYLDNQGFLSPPRFYESKSVQALLFKIGDTGNCLTFYVIQRSGGSVTLGCYTADIVGPSFYSDTLSTAQPPCNIWATKEPEFIRIASRAWTEWQLLYGQSYINHSVAIVNNFNIYQMIKTFNSPKTPLIHEYQYGV